MYIDTHTCACMPACLPAGPPHGLIHKAGCYKAVVNNYHSIIFLQFANLLLD